MFYGESNQSRKDMKELYADATAPLKKAKQLMNLDSLSAYLRAKFPEREHSNSKEVSRLLKTLASSGFRTIGEIDELIDAGSAAFELFEMQSSPIVRKGRKKGQKRWFTDVGVVRITLEIVSDTFLRENRRNSERKLGHAELEEEIKNVSARYETYRRIIKKSG